MKETGGHQTAIHSRVQETFDFRTHPRSEYRCKLLLIALISLETPDSLV